MNKMEQVQEYDEHGRNKGQTRLDVSSQTVPNSFQITDNCNQEQGCFDTYALIPGSFLTNLHIFRHTVSVLETVVCQNNGRADEGFHQQMKTFIVHIHGVSVPGNNPTKVIREPTELDSNTPAALISTFFAHLLRAAALQDGKNQFSGIAVNHREEGGISQQQLIPILMRWE